MVKKILIGVVLVAALVPVVVMGPFLLRVKSVDANPEAGFYAPYFVYVSRAASKAAKSGGTVVLLVQPNNSGTISDDPEFHEKDAWWTTFGRHRLAEHLGVVLLVPGFIRPADDWQVYTHALDRDVFTTARPELHRPDLQLIRMIEDLRERVVSQELVLHDRFLLQGYSASGMFANRFAVLHPELVLGVAAGSPGGWPIVPLAEYDGETLNYPAGIADLAELAGRPFDLEAYRGVHQLLVMGSDDENDSLDYTDGWGEEHSAVVDRLFGTSPLARWDDAQRAYAMAGARAEFLLVQGVGHDRRALQEHSTAFFERLLGLD